MARQDDRGHRGMTEMDAAEKSSGSYGMALACAGVLDAGLTSEGAVEIVKIIDGIRAEAREQGRQAGLEEAEHAATESCGCAADIRALKDKPGGGQ